jgi:hypothetical protein
MATLKTGVFTISLDFELHWGVSENRTIESYRENLENVPLVVENLLALFTEFEIHTTWATVGMLFCKNKAELLATSDALTPPQYFNEKLSNYRIFHEVGENERRDPFHYALSLIKKIQATPHQEVGTHTFSHYYCLERGQTLQHFQEDLEAAYEMAIKEDISLKSIVFPRNQYERSYIDCCVKKGIIAYRGTENHWMYRTRSREDETKTRRALRFVDAYFAISGDNTYTISRGEAGAVNVPSSRFLRPYSKKLALLEPLRLHRIKKEMTDAAKNKRLYHLWWHPHNFGKNLVENVAFLVKILEHYQFLNKQYGMMSLNMAEIAQTTTSTHAQ